MVVDPRTSTEQEQPPEDKAPRVAASEVYAVPNMITIARLLLVPFFFVVLVSGAANERLEDPNLLAFVLFAVAAFTDFLDGTIARRTHTVTNLGKVLDPIVDRALIASGVIGLYLVGRLPLWVVIALILRDAYLLSGSAVLERHGLRLPVTRLGKWTTAVLLVGFSSLIWDFPRVPFGSGEAALGIYLVYLGLALSLTAAVQYTFRARRALKHEAAR